MGCNFIKSPGETKLSNHCAQEQCWVLGRLEEWANQNVWKFKNKQNILHMRWTNPLQWGGNWFPREQFCGKGPGGCGGQQAEELPALCSGSKEGCSVFLGCIIRTGSRSKGVIFLFIWHSLDHIWTIATSFEHFGTRKESQLEQFQWRAIRMAPPTGMIPCSNFVIQVNFVL